MHSSRLQLKPVAFSITALLLAVATAPAATPAAKSSAFTQAVSVIAPVRVQLTRTLLATGSIQAWQEVIIAPEVGGYQVAAVNVDVGDRVKRGQELVRLSSQLLESQVAMASATVSQTQAGLANATAALNRGETVFAAGVLSRADLDTLRANQISAQANVASAQANLDSAQLKLRFTHVRAPDDGVISARVVTVGQIAQAGTEVLRLLRQNRVEWRAEIPEADMHSVKAGQLATISTVGGLTIKGTVRAIAPTVQSNNRTAIAYVNLPPNSGAQPGMYARGEINISQSSALMVPAASVVVLDGYSYVYVLKAGNAVERRRVSAGIIKAGQMEITQGLSESERVVSSGGAFLTDGQLVNVKPAS
jgi:RND family efflux transporter MFP subunit